MTAMRGSPLPSGSGLSADPARLAAHVAVALGNHLDRMRKDHQAVPSGLEELAALCRAWARGNASTTAAPPAVARQVLTVAEAAGALSVSESTVKRLIASGDLAAVSIGGSRRVPVTAITAYLDRLTGSGRVTPGHAGSELARLAVPVDGAEHGQGQ